MKTLRKTTSITSTVILTLSLTLLGLLCLGFITHTKPMVVYSDSMKPTFQAGDVIITRSVPASSVEVGEIITFQDPERGALVTHRLVEKEVDGDQLAMTTQGDANTGQEEWKIVPSGKVGQYHASIPKVGYATKWMQNRAVSVALIATAVLFSVFTLLYQIWGKGRGADETA